MNSDFASAKRKHAARSTNPRDVYLTLLDTFPALIWRSGVDAKCDYFNQTWLEFTGRSMGQEIGDGWTVGVHSEDLAGCLQCFLKAFHSRRPFSIEYRLRRYDGEYRWILDQGRAFNDLDGRFAGYIGSCFDVTERKEAEKALKNSHKQQRALSVRLQSVREEESERISREIHDELGQALTGLNMDLNWIQLKLKKEKSLLLRAQFERRIKSMTASLKTTVRSVQRISTELRPLMLDDLGLPATLEWQAEEFEERTGIRCRWKRRLSAVTLSRRHATALFRIFQEILTNVGRHAHAHSASLKLVQRQDELILEVADDGKGFCENKLQEHKSLGLLGIRERAAFIGGRVEIHSAPGKGTKVTVTSPIIESRKHRDLKSRSPHGKKSKNSHSR